MYTIADRLEHYATMQLDYLPQNSVMAREDIGHRVRMLLPELRTALYVGK